LQKVSQIYELLDFLKITVTAIVCLATFIDCQTSLICGERRNAGRASDGAVGL